MRLKPLNMSCFAFLKFYWNYGSPTVSGMLKSKFRNHLERNWSKKRFHMRINEKIYKKFRQIPSTRNSLKRKNLKTSHPTSPWSHGLSQNSYLLSFLMGLKNRFQGVKKFWMKVIRKVFWVRKFIPSYIIVNVNLLNLNLPKPIPNVILTSKFSRVIFLLYTLPWSLTTNRERIWKTSHRIWMSTRS